MALRLYNTLTRRKEEFRPIDPANVRVYVCGPTVYDYAHIGNARPVIVFDVLYRLLKHLAARGEWNGGKGETKVTYVRNITDVDDKINRRAAEDFPDLPLNEAIRRVTETTNAQFQADVKALGCLEPDAQPRATEHIEAMRALIERLIEVGVAYVADDHVLFSPSEMNRRSGPRYGSLSRRSLDEMIAGARVDVASYKRDEMDFVLWKPSKEGEPGWPSPGGIVAPGRPGWHIECSAMSMAELLQPFGGGLGAAPEKNVFDIHAGGIDLVFPHHENEIAQSCMAFGAERMANVWMHNGFLQVEGRKMAKSEGNFVTINELLSTNGFGGRSWPGQVLRLAMLKTHYRQPIDWTIESLVEARKALKLWSTLSLPFEGAAQVGSHVQEWPRPSAALVEALEDDLNTPLAISRLHEVASSAHNSEIAREQLFSDAGFLGLLDPHSLWVHQSTVVGTGSVQIEKFYDHVLQLKSAIANRNETRIQELVRGIEAAGASVDWSWSGFVSLQEPVDKVVVGQLVESRNAARAAKDWTESDRIRDELLAMGVTVKDNKDGTTAWEVKR